MPEYGFGAGGGLLGLGGGPWNGRGTVRRYCVTLRTWTLLVCEAATLLAGSGVLVHIGEGCLEAVDISVV